jgi:beta-glucosidase
MDGRRNDGRRNDLGGRFRPWALSMASAAGLGAVALAGAAHALPPSDQPWMNTALSPDARATLLEAQMTQAEKLGLVVGEPGVRVGVHQPPPQAMGSAGYVPGVQRLGVPALQESDAGMGVSWAHGVRPHRFTTGLPSGLAVAATWDPVRAYEGGAMIGTEASRLGFNVLLAGGVDLTREPRNGRNFEYAGEDPLLAGVMVAQAIRGIQDQHVVATIKHYALNDQETGRTHVSSDIGDRAARESDLLAFQIALQHVDPGSVMCSYNLVNGVYACQNDYLLNQVLKGDWGYRGWVMSDWGAVHDAAASANGGLDQESAAAAFDTQVYFGAPLEAALKAGTVPSARLDDMVHRILRTLFAVGVIDHPPAVMPLDFVADGAVSQRAAAQSMVLLKDVNGLLPLPQTARRIAVIGGHADVGVLSGGGSSQVEGPGGNVVPGLTPKAWPGPPVFQLSSPLDALRAARPKATFVYADGRDAAAAAALAAHSDAVIVVATQWLGEGFDAKSLGLPDGQDDLIAAVAAANPKTVVVLETGGPVLMPWLDRVGAVVEAWYPGTRGGLAIAQVLTGAVEASGRLPITFPASEAQLPRPVLDGLDKGDARFSTNYGIEGAAVGYKWFDLKGLTPLFPFGYGLSYTRFAYAHLTARREGQGVVVTFDVTNSGARAGMDTPQVYLGLSAAPGEPPKRLVGWSKLELAPGVTRHVEVHVPPLMLAAYDEADHGWRIAAGDYPIYLSASAAAADIRLTSHISLAAVAVAGR